MPSIDLAHLKRLFDQLKKFSLSSNLYKHFAVELTILIVAIFVVGTNVAIRINENNGQAFNQSLFFVYLKKHPEMNQKLVDAYGSINIKVTQSPTLAKQVLAASVIEKGDEEASDDDTPLPTLSGSTLLKPNPASTNSVLRRDILSHVVESGQTVSQIALLYGVSESTILAENNLSVSSTIRPGDELNILPTSGVSHKIQSGETLYSIAEQYGVGDIEAILDFNNIEFAELIYPGETIVIPNGTKKAPPVPSSYLASLRRNDVDRADVPADFQGTSTGLIWPFPTSGNISQGYWSRHRALDITGNRQNIVAAADGIVEESGWLGGYGYQALVNHGNGLKTRYAHASELLVSAGQRVGQGQIIMLSGSTGRSSGPHLHFEVIQNGRFLNPLSVVSR